MNFLPTAYDEFSGFLPHGHCYLWQSDLLWLHVVSDALIVCSYYSIPFALFYLLIKRRDIQFGWIYAGFGLFILLCGTTHLLSIWNIWVPDYWLSGVVKAATAVSSVTTALLIWPLIPKVLAIPSQAELMAANQALADEVQSHRTTLHELRKLSSAIEHSSGMVVITDVDTRIQYCNPAFFSITGYQRDEVIGQKINLIKSNLTSVEAYENLWATLTSGNAWHGEFLNRKKNGDVFWCLESIAPVLDENDTVTNFVSIIHDISDRKDSEQLICHMAYFDPLTDLPNRSLFSERLDQAIAYAKRNRGLFSVMYLDLDKFKHVNDSLGHTIGDKLLIEVGRRINACLREQETVARLGGDEFAIISLQLRVPADAGDIAQRIIDVVKQPLTIDGHSVIVSTSIGISVYPDDATDAPQLVKHADDALYTAKRHGRNKFEFYNAADNAKAMRRMRIESHLRKAMDKGEFSLRYQPEIDLKTGRICGAEALLRWNSELGLIGPDEFILIAEHSGIIAELGVWVLKNACRDFSRPEFRGLNELKIAINLSARQFKHAGLYADVKRVLEETGFPGNRLQLELTETALMDDVESAIAQMQMLKGLGIELAIDDFGTGFSSLSYLRRFPVDTLKIDKSFVGDLVDANDACIVRSVIGLAHGLKLKVIAEGVETAAQAQLLEEYGCDQAQGYWYAAPAKIEEFCRLFQSKTQV